MICFVFTKITTSLDVAGRFYSRSAPAACPN